MGDWRELQRLLKLWLALLRAGRGDGVGAGFELQSDETGSVKVKEMSEMRSRRTVIEVFAQTSVYLILSYHLPAA